MTTGGKTYFYLTDATGSVIDLVDMDGNKVDTTYTYSSRGVRILDESSEAVAQPYGFVSATTRSHRPLPSAGSLLRRQHGPLHPARLLGPGGLNPMSGADARLVPAPIKGVHMPNVIWSVEQRAAVKRWMLFASIFVVAGIILSVALIAAGNPGGWVLLLLTVCPYGSCYFYIENMKAKQPR
ncbi:hypothetical protein [Streptomyces sp. NPDC005476]|uniref:hypothetical protein n=1 Tax=Streptomyces sp. NPDC005476 TaxID=3156882 RepID=UPI0034570101